MIVGDGAGTGRAGDANGIRFDPVSIEKTVRHAQERQAQEER